MAKLPDPTEGLSAEARAALEHMAAARSHADGRPQLGEVYVTMFNNPAIAERVGALGEHLRFGGILPDETRELAIIRYSAREGFGYEWSHHQRPVAQAGVDQATIDAVTRGEVPSSLPPSTQAVLLAVDAVAARQPIPDDVQSTVVDAHGTAGVVEVVALCGLYALMGYTVTAFDIETEPGFPPAPF